MPQLNDFIHQHFADTKQIVIFGLGQEGKSSYSFLRQLLPEMPMTLIDDKLLSGLPSFWNDEVTSQSHVQYINTTDASTLDFSNAMVFQTPGISLNHPLRAVLMSENTVITSNTQLFFDVLTAIYPHLKTIGITGTKGKSTTSSLIYHLLQTARIPSWLGGNIGQPALELMPAIANNHEDHGYVVLELSSHQLDLMHSSPNIAVVQNIIPEHLDYYTTFDRYQAAKSHITQFQQPEDIVIFNPAYDTSSEVAAESVGQKLTFGLQSSAVETPGHQLTASALNDKIYVHPSSHHEPTFVLNVDEIALKGRHNLENILPSVVIGEILKLPLEIVTEALTSFRGLEHRLEHVATVNGVEYYNDSLATVPNATVAALEAFPKQPVILIAGGYDRGVGVKDLAEYLLANPVKALVLFPTTGTLLAEEIETLRQANPDTTLPVFPIHHVTKMVEAVKLATQEADENDIVLMSPAAASFNLFRDYQDRGHQFKAAVQELPLDD